MSVLDVVVWSLLIFALLPWVALVFGETKRPEPKIKQVKRPTKTELDNELLMLGALLRLWDMGAYSTDRLRVKCNDYFNHSTGTIGVNFDSLVTRLLMTSQMEMRWSKQKSLLYQELEEWKSSL